MYNYFIILLFIFLGLLIGITLQIIGNIFGKHKSYTEKNLPYECGFNSPQNSRIKFNIKYYLMAILFILFDIETIIFFPLCSYIKQSGINGYIIIITFIIELIISFIYIWRKGALNWS